MRLLEQLINKSLVVMEETNDGARYRMLETIRQYANEKLIESGENDTLRDKHLEYFLYLTETAAPYLIRPEQLEWLTQLDANYENLRLALEWALSKASAGPSLRLCAALGKFWTIRCHWIEGSKWLARALAKPEQNQDDSEKVARVRALCEDAELAESLDNLERMKTSAELGLKLAQEMSSRRDIAVAKFYIGWALERQGDYKRATPFMEQSFTEFQELDDSYWKALTHLWLGVVQSWLGAIQFNQGKLKPIEHCLRSVELARAAGERIHLAKALTEYSYLLCTDERTDEARKYLEDVQKLSKQISSNTSPLNFVVAQFGLALIEWLDGNHQRAKALFMESQVPLRLLGEKFTSSNCIECLGLLSIETDDLTQAQVYLEEALSTAREFKVEFYVARRLAVLGILFYLQGSIEESKQNFRESISLTKDLNPYTKACFLESLFISPYFQMPRNSVLLLGAINSFMKGFDTPIESLSMMEALFQHYCLRAEAQARESLGEVAFESALAEGQKMSLDEALDLALKTVEDM
jgi:tetratricopeptide (TPR) repeat protein